MKALPGLHWLLELSKVTHTYTPFTLCPYSMCSVPASVCPKCKPVSKETSKGCQKMATLFWVATPAKISRCLSAGLQNPRKPLCLRPEKVSTRCSREKSRQITSQRLYLALGKVNFPSNLRRFPQASGQERDQQRWVPCALHSALCGAAAVCKQASQPSAIHDMTMFVCTRGDKQTKACNNPNLGHPSMSGRLPLKEPKVLVDFVQKAKWCSTCW